MTIIHVGVCGLDVDSQLVGKHLTDEGALNVPGLIAEIKTVVRLPSTVMITMMWEEWPE